MLTLLKVVLNSLLVVIIMATMSEDVGDGEISKNEAFVQRFLNKRKYLDGRVRIIGPTKYEGNVYIYHLGEWGAICDDSWDDIAATVVCRMFNTTTGTATYRSHYGNATQKFWMDDVVCEGQESSITQCTFSGWGLSDCDASEAAGVVCINPIATINDIIS